MKISIEDLREAGDIAGQAGGAEAAIVAQFLVDLAVNGAIQLSWRNDRTAGGP
jgi:hypothetical protein